jgi:hypothetical protein
MPLIAREPLGLLEPDARKPCPSGSEGAPVQQCAGATRLPLATRMFHCHACGLILDRDLNAARNLARIVELVAGSGSGDSKRPWRGQKTRPGRAVPGEAGSQRRADGPDQAGTAGPQGSAA